MRFPLLLLSLLTVNQLGLAQTKPTAKKPKLTDQPLKYQDTKYKETPQGDLLLHGYFPLDWKASDQRPVIVFFFGGGWKNGSHTQFQPQGEYLASRGIVAFAADYRIASIHKTTPDICIEDAKSAIRFVRANAAKFGIDPKKVIGSGGSAGGHIAAATALVPGFDAKDDPKDVSSVPNALVLYNPGLHYTQGKILGSQGKEINKAISPTLFVTKDTPPTLLMYGTKDPALAQGQEYVTVAKKFGVRAELYTAAEQPHSFFNRAPWIQSTMNQVDQFLESLGYLQGKPTIAVPTDSQLKKVEN